MADLPLSCCSCDLHAKLTRCLKFKSCHFNLLHLFFLPGMSRLSWKIISLRNLGAVFFFSLLKVFSLSTLLAPNATAVNCLAVQSLGCVQMATCLWDYRGAVILRIKFWVHQWREAIVQWDRTWLFRRPTRSMEGSNTLICWLRVCSSCVSSSCVW